MVSPILKYTWKVCVYNFYIMSCEVLKNEQDFYEQVSFMIQKNERI